MSRGVSLVLARILLRIPIAHNLSIQHRYSHYSPVVVQGGAQKPCMRLAQPSRLCWLSRLPLATSKSRHHGHARAPQPGVDQVATTPNF